MPQTCNFLKVYLLNDGKFALIKEYHSNINIEKMSHALKEFQEHVNQKKIIIGELNYPLTIVSALAYGEDTLINAEIGLKKISKNKKDFIVATNFLEEASKNSHQKLNQFMMLKKAIESYNIVSYFQPIVDNQTLKVQKYESLVRLIDQNRNIISPYHFLETAKEGKYYQEITSIVLRNSFRALFNDSIEISINLSALDLEDVTTQNELLILLEKYKTQVHRITIEVIEDEKINDTQETQKFIQKIKRYGVKIALDDFGKGLSNFTRIQSYQPDYIKIDGGLIRNIEQDSFSKDLVETIVFFAKKRNIKTIAEFVENETIFNIIKDLGVDYSQGHYFGKAGLLKEFIPDAL